tara:strand:- start:375 stop:512 length:138 start_codon:yes stop_codon:yes gene_type:complete
MACRLKKDNNVIGYIEIPEGYWTMTTTVDTDDLNKYWHNGEDNEN